MPVTTVHQSLHGYSAGHQLLGSSVQLSSESNWLILTMSDLSGPVVADGPTTYLTGYPVPSEDLYALARTWVAAEGSRPGSVWTHTLFLGAEALRNVPHLANLTSLFVHPSSSTSDYDYQSPIRINPETELSTVSRQRLEPPVVRSLVSALYPLGAVDVEPVVVPTSDFAAAESTILGLWTQQWPRLRQRFSFSTGSSLLRRLPNRQALRIQIVPFSRVSALRISEGAGVHFVEPDESDSQPPWLIVASEDPTSRRGADIRQFLWSFSQDTDPTPASFRALAEALAKIEGRRQAGKARSLGRLLGDRFPNPPQARTLKSVTFGPAAERNAAGLVNFSEGEVIGALLGKSIGQAFDPVLLDLLNRVIELARLDTKTALDLGKEIRDPSEAIGETVLSGLARALSEDHLCDLVQAREDLVLPILRRRPAIASLANFWRTGSAVHEAVIESLASEPWDDDERRTAIKAMVTVHTGGLAQQAVKRLGSIVVRAAIDHFVAGVEIGSRWTSVLLSQPMELLDSLLAETPRLTPEAEVVVVSAVQRSSREMTTRWSPDSWRRLLDAQEASGCGKLGESIFQQLIGLRGAAADEMLKETFSALRRCSHAPADLDRSIAIRFLLTTWAPELFLRSYTTRTSLAEALTVVRNDASLRRKMRALKRQARQSERGWRRRLVDVLQP